jgi:hypothetical protein
MRYYKTDDGKLIQFNPETKVYKLRNTIEKVDTRISPDQLDLHEIKKDKFSLLMNEFFKSVKHSWVHNSCKFRKLDNFESDGISLSTNYVIGKDIPLHEIDDMKWIGKVILVYHWGKVYYHTISYNGYKQGQLIDPYTKQLVRWAQLKHCSPIFNEETKTIC